MTMVLALSPVACPLSPSIPLQAYIHTVNIQSTISLRCCVWMTTIPPKVTCLKTSVMPEVHPFCWIPSSASSSALLLLLVGHVIAAEPKLFFK